MINTFSLLERKECSYLVPKWTFAHDLLSRPSIALTWLSRPRVNTIKKNRNAQIAGDGRFANPRGYTTKSRSGPEKRVKTLTKKVYS